MFAKLLLLLLVLCMVSFTAAQWGQFAISLRSRKITVFPESPIFQASAARCTAVCMAAAATADADTTVAVTDAAMEAWAAWADGDGASK